MTTVYTPQSDQWPEFESYGQDGETAGSWNICGTALRFMIWQTGQLHPDGRPR